MNYAGAMGGMARTSAPPGPNMIDGGAISKPQLNSQPLTNATYTTQTIGQNTVSAGQQANVNAQRALDVQRDNVTDQEVAAQQFARQRIAETLYANDAGSAMMKLNSISQSPEKQKMMNDLAVSKAMSVGSSPALGSAAASAAQYA